MAEAQALKDVRGSGVAVDPTNHPLHPLLDLLRFQVDHQPNLQNGETSGDCNASLIIAT